jgi:hypothetical protein
MGHNEDDIIGSLQCRVTPCLFVATGYSLKKGGRDPALFSSPLFPGARQRSGENEETITEGQTIPTLVPLYRRSFWRTGSDRFDPDQDDGSGLPGRDEKIDRPGLIRISLLEYGGTPIDRLTGLIRCADSVPDHTTGTHDRSSASAGLPRMTASEGIGGENAKDRVE